jgi:hypothetical protein
MGTIAKLLIALLVLSLGCENAAGPEEPDAGRGEDAETPWKDAGSMSGGADLGTPDDVPADGGTRQPETGADAMCGGVEVCDGVDNDCDGSVDEDLRRACSDLCDGTGSQECSGGVWLACEPTAADAEICDELDNDCDGLVDEELMCPAPRPRLTVLVLAGQSNMVGLGYNSELTAAQAADVPRAHIYLNDSVHNNPNRLNWTGLRPGFGVTPTRFGPELSFGRHLRELWPDHTIAIIKVAEGATALHDRWAAGTGDLYQLLVAEVEQQMRDLQIEWRPELAGFIWMQGESDAIDRSHANAYATRFEAFISQLRSDLGVPLLPVVSGLIVEQSLWPYAGTVRAGVSGLAESQPMMETAETTDLPLHPDDPAHHDTAGNLGAGTRLADSLARMYPAQWNFPDDFSSVQGESLWSYHELLPNGTALELTYDETTQRWNGLDGFVSETVVRPDHPRVPRISWRAPLGGRVKVTAVMTAAGGEGGDGTEATIGTGAHTLWGPALLANGRSIVKTIELDVVQGDLFTFTTGTGPAGNATGDGLEWDITVEYVER